MISLSLHGRELTGYFLPFFFGVEAIDGEPEGDPCFAIIRPAVLPLNPSGRSVFFFAILGSFSYRGRQRRIASRTSGW